MKSSMGDVRTHLTSVGDAQKLKSSDVDGVRAWVTMVASLLSIALAGIFLYSMGFVHKALLDKYGESVAKTALVGSLFSCMACLAG
jgi:hypothetical protein